MQGFQYIDFMEPMQRFQFLVRMPNWLGDAVMATACLHDLKAHFPDSSITVLAPPAIQELLQENPNIDHRIVFSRKKGEKSKEAKRVQEEIKARSFDLGILLTGSLSSAWQLYRAGVPRRIGFGCHFRSPLLTDAIPETPKTMHLVESYKELLRPLYVPSSLTAPELFLSGEEKREAEGILASYGIEPHHRLIGINPGAAYGSAKCWPPEYFRELTEKLLDDANTRLIYFGDPLTKALVDHITEHFPKERVINLAGRTSLRLLIALIDCCTLFITNDSGPMHIRAALKKPLVAIFGSTNEIKTGPYGMADSVIHNHVPCSPCYLRKCPIDFRCMRTIRVADVLRAVEAS